MQRHHAALTAATRTPATPHPKSYCCCCCSPAHTARWLGCGCQVSPHVHGARGAALALLLLHPPRQAQAAPRHQLPQQHQLGYALLAAALSAPHAQLERAAAVAAAWLLPAAALQEQPAAASPQRRDAPRVQQVADLCVRRAAVPAALLAAQCPAPPDELAVLQRPPGELHVVAVWLLLLLRCGCRCVLLLRRLLLHVLPRHLPLYELVLAQAGRLQVCLLSARRCCRQHQLRSRAAGVRACRAAAGGVHGRGRAPVLCGTGGGRGADHASAQQGAAEQKNSRR